jgi:hypothetical protein
MTEPDNTDIILVDLGPMPGVRGVASFSPESMVEKSSEAIDRAMGTIRAMAAKINTTMQGIKITERPNKVSVEFGIKMTADADALVAKVGTEAAIKVTLSWEHSAK